MNAVLHIAWGNALMATALAVVITATARFWRRPAVLHSLWVLVLFKLITPSFVACRIPWPEAPLVSALGVPAETRSPRLPEVSKDEDRTISAADVAELALSGESDGWPAAAPLLSEDGSAQSMLEPPTMVASSALDRPGSATGREAATPWVSLLGGIWIAGSLAYLILIAYRIHRFRRLLSYARPPSPGLSNQAQRLAHHLGLPVCPAVWLVPGKVSPMVWALGRRPQLFVPSVLWEQLSEAQQSALLVHELAHLRRRDQWVRGLELIVTVLYWWHPVVWWACREIREAEEQCCDAWVVWTLPGAARAYATALLQTIDFLSETQIALPAVASGIGHVHDLRRRLTMIMHGTTPRGLSGPGWALVLGLGALLLPLLPTWTRAQEAEPRERRASQQAEEQQRRAEERRRQAEEVDRADRDDRIRAAERESLRAERQAAENQVAEMSRHVETMKREFQRAMEQLQAAEKRLSRLRDSDERGRRESEAGRARSQLLPPRRERSGDSERRLSELEQKLDALIQEVQSLRREMRRPGPAMRGPGGMPGAPGMRPPSAAPAVAPVPPGGPFPRARPGSPAAVPATPAPALAPAAPVPPGLPAPGQVPLAEPPSSPDPRPVAAPHTETPRS
jgi:beta-lactamase regulating signal transducer with metallopeptidase domain